MMHFIMVRSLHAQHSVNEPQLRLNLKYLINSQALLILILFLGIGYPLWATPPTGFFICEKELEEIYGNGQDRDAEPFNSGFTIVQENGAEVGFLDTYITPDGSHLLRSFFWLRPSWRKKGVGREVIAALMRRYPQLTLVYVALALDNLDIYLMALSQNMSREQALQKTPVYKLFEPYGFTKITFLQDEKDEEAVSVELRR
jgi:GNAT superfamily N-acetyltransferase